MSTLFYLMGVTDPDVCWVGFPRKHRVPRERRGLRRHTGKNDINLQALCAPHHKPAPTTKARSTIGCAWMCLHSKRVKRPVPTEIISFSLLARAMIGASVTLSRECYLPMHYFLWDLRLGVRHAPALPSLCLPPTSAFPKGRIWTRTWSSGPARREK